jgi:hypothetical protein
MALLGLIQEHPPVAVSGRLAQAVGAESATLMQLADAGLHNDDAGVRLEAIRTMVQTIEGAPDLRAGVIGAVSSMDVGEFSTMLRGVAGERAEEVAMHVASQARATELRSKASTLLQQLRRSRAGS